MDAAAIEDLICRQSGLLGVSGISSDMRALRASSGPAAGEACQAHLGAPFLAYPRDLEAHPCGRLLQYFGAPL